MKDSRTWNGREDELHVVPGHVRDRLGALRQTWNRRLFGLGDSSKPFSEEHFNGGNSCLVIGDEDFLPKLLAAVRAGRGGPGGSGCVGSGVEQDGADRVELVGGSLGECRSNLGGGDGGIVVAVVRLRLGGDGPFDDRVPAPGIPSFPDGGLAVDLDELFVVAAVARLG